MKQVYVLELEGLTSSGSKRFYVGTSGDVEQRYEKHAKGEGCEYTKQFKPKHLVEVYDAGSGSEREALEMEDSITEKYILAYGSGVRGGHYLNESDVQSVFMKDKHQKNLCYRCGEPGHYSNKCSHSNFNSNANSTQSEKQKHEEGIEDKKARLAKIKVSLWSSGNSKYSDSMISNDQEKPLQICFGAQTHANNKNHKVETGALFCDTSGGGWTIRGLVSHVSFVAEKNAFLLTIAPMPETGLSIRSSIEQHGKVGIAKALGLPLPSYNWTSSGIVVHRI